MLIYSGYVDYTDTRYNNRRWKGPILRIAIATEVCCDAGWLLQRLSSCHNFYHNKLGSGMDRIEGLHPIEEASSWGCERGWGLNYPWIGTAALVISKCWLKSSMLWNVLKKDSISSKNDAEFDSGGASVNSDNAAQASVSSGTPFGKVSAQSCCSSDNWSALMSNEHGSSVSIASGSYPSRNPKSASSTRGASMGYVAPVRNRGADCDGWVIWSFHAVNSSSNITVFCLHKGQKRHN